MPVNLSIKNVPDDIAARLRERAKNNRRSVQGELLAILEQAVEPKPLSVREAYEQVKRLGLKTGDEATAIVREERDARYGS